MSPPVPPPDTACGNAEVNVVQADHGHAAGIARIYNHYVNAGGATFDTAHWTVDHVVELIDKPEPDGWYVALAESDVIGWASARPYSLRHGYRFTCETAIYLDPSALGSGLGDRLQERIEAHCRHCKLHHAVARIVADNQRSLAFHYRFGYQLVGIQKEIGHMDGSWIDVAILQKIF